MLTKIIDELITRDLSTLKREIEQFETEADIWLVRGDIPNSAGNLCLHLVGNLRHYFGTVLAGTDYVRDRDREFSDKNVPRAELLAGIDAAAADVSAALRGLSEEDLAENYPIDVFGRPMTTAFFLTHLATHLGYHLGQINYHRRLLRAA